MFSHKKPKKIGTPTKKIKLNQSSDQSISDFQISLNNLVFIRNISKYDDQCDDYNWKNKNNKQIRNFQVSDFQMRDINKGALFQDNDKENYSNYLNKGIKYKQKYVQKFDEQYQQSQQQQQLIVPKFTKKFTMGQKALQQQPQQYDNLIFDLSLARHNSTFPISNLNQQNLNLLGENIYLTDLLKLHSKISTNQAVNDNQDILRKNKQEQEDDEKNNNRLKKDYQIKENLNKLKCNKMGYICLNKLEKIFYYVKRIINNNNHTHKSNHQFNLPLFTTKIQSFSNIQKSNNKNNTNQQQKHDYSSSLHTKTHQMKTISDQIRLFHRDSDGFLPRFYQQWLQDNSIYMIFQLASYSLHDKTQVFQKLPENQIWSIIYDSTKCLKWLYSKQKVHLNIKPGNILKCRTKYKLTDPFVQLQNFQNYLSFTQHIQSSADSIYLAPQILQFKSYLHGLDFSKCQIFSLGMILIQNITLLPIKSNEYLKIKNYFKKHVHGYSSYLKRLLLRMIDKNCQRRPGLEELGGEKINQWENKDKDKEEIKEKRSKSV